MRKHNFAFIDTEMTGLDISKHELIEIGCVLTTPRLRVIEEFELKIKPERIEDADPISLKINHYDPKAWEGACALPEALRIFASKVKDAIMVGHNISLDAAFLESAFARTDMANTLHYHRLDTVSIAWAKLHRERNLVHFSLRELCHRFGIENREWHTALGDARATYELYKKLMQL